MVGAFFGCAKDHGLLDYPRFDQVLVYNRPYDVTYLRTLEALNEIPGWVLERTDKEKGEIVIRNREYGHLFSDRDKLSARVLIKRLSRTQTSVELDDEAERLEQGGELLDAVDHMMGNFGAIAI